MAGLRDPCSRCELAEIFQSGASSLLGLEEPVASGKLNPKCMQGLLPLLKQRLRGR